MKKKPLFELALTFSGIMFFFWVVHPIKNIWLSLSFALLFFSFFIYSHFQAGEGFRDLGIRWDNWREAVKWTLPLTAVGVVLTVLFWSRFFPVAFFFEESRLWKTLLIYPIWGFIQQYITLAVMLNKLRDIFPENPRVVLLTVATLFSLLHLPNPPLMVLCFFGELMWGWIYLRSPNLFVIALSHGIFGNLCRHVLALNLNVGAHGDWTFWSKLV